MNSAEINAAFYSLQRPDRYRSWAAQTPPDFRFAVKGGRYITHMKRLRNVRQALANYFASGVLELGARLGPILWQLPARSRFDETVLDDFFRQLPRSTTDAAALARYHDQRLDGRSATSTDADRPLRHAIEVRNDSFLQPAFHELLRVHNIAVVMSDGAGHWPLTDTITADFVYIRLHGSERLYGGGYDADALSSWAERIRDWSTERDVFVYFDNDADGRAPFDAEALLNLVTA